jgi:hypothetical protein
MRDIRADLIERLEHTSKARTKAEHLYRLEMSDIETKYKSVLDGYEIEIERLNLLLASECDRYERLGRNAIPPHRAGSPRQVSEIKAAAPADPILSSDDAKRRLEGLSDLIRNFHEQESPKSNVHQLPADQVPRSRVG